MRMRLLSISIGEEKTAIPSFGSLQDQIVQSNGILHNPLPFKDLPTLMDA